MHCAAEFLKKKVRKKVKSGNYFFFFYLCLAERLDVGLAGVDAVGCWREKKVLLLWSLKKNKKNQCLLFLKENFFSHIFFRCKNFCFFKFEKMFWHLLFFCCRLFFWRSSNKAKNEGRRTLVIFNLIRFFFWSKIFLGL